MTLNGVMAVTLRYFTEFGKPVFHVTRNHVDLWRNSCTSLLYFVVSVRCCRSLSHLLMSFLLSFGHRTVLFNSAV